MIIAFIIAIDILVSLMIVLPILYADAMKCKSVYGDFDAGTNCSLCYSDHNLYHTWLGPGCGKWI